MKRLIKALALLAAVGMALCLTGCRMSSNTGSSSGLSDIDYANSEQYTAGGAELTETVERIAVSWPVGSVTVKPHSSDTVSFSEESARELTEGARLHYWLDGTVLHIQFCQAGKWLLDEMEKDLTILVPDDLALAEAEVNSLSAEVCLDGLRADRLTIEAVSGNIRLTGCAVTELVNISTTSGDMRLTDCAVTKMASISTLSGELETDFTQPLEEFSGNSTSGTFRISAPAVKNFSFNSISGPVRLDLEEAPKALNIQTTSGDIELALPEDAAFTLDYDATSGDISSDLPYTMESGRYIFGDGTGEYVIGAISGDVRITAPNK